eukprot:SAG11_NODE_799_length_7127_cov_3.180279_5_plen_133_part_00
MLTASCRTRGMTGPSPPSERRPASGSVLESHRQRELWAGRQCGRDNVLSLDGPFKQKGADCEAEALRHEHEDAVVRADDHLKHLPQLLGVEIFACMRLAARLAQQPHVADMGVSDADHVIDQRWKPYLRALQ